MIKIKVDLRSEKPRNYEGDYEFLENQSSQENMISFFISTHNENESADIEFFIDSLEELDELIESLNDVRGKFIDKHSQQYSKDG